MYASISLYKVVPFLRYLPLIETPFTTCWVWCRVVAQQHLPCPFCCKILSATYKDTSEASPDFSMTRSSYDSVIDSLSREHVPSTADGFKIPTPRNQKLSTPPPSALSTPISNGDRDDIETPATVRHSLSNQRTSTRRKSLQKDAGQLVNSNNHHSLEASGPIVMGAFDDELVICNDDGERQRCVTPDSTKHKYKTSSDPLATRSKGHAQNLTHPSTAKKFRGSVATGTGTIATSKSNRNGRQLGDWWLRVSGSVVQVEGMLLGGDSQTQTQWHSTAIVKRLAARRVTTKSGSLYILVGDFRLELCVGCSNQAASMFQKANRGRGGFPVNWDTILKKDKTVDGDEATETETTADQTKRDIKNSRRTTKRTVTKELAGPPVKKAKKISPSATGVAADNYKSDADGAGIKSESLESISLPKSRSGRTVVPPLAYWTGQRVIENRRESTINIQSGDVDHTALSPTMFNLFRVTEEKDFLVQSPTLTPARRTSVVKPTGQKRQRIRDNKSQDDRQGFSGGTWSTEEVSRLKAAIKRFGSTGSAEHWDSVALAVRTRSAEECCAEHMRCTPPKVAKAEQSELDPAVNTPTLRARPGTQKSKQEMRQLLNHRNKNYNDDLFESDAFNSSNTGFQLSIATIPELSSSANAKRQSVNMKDSAFSDTESPGLLRLPVQRERADAYVGHTLRANKQVVATKSTINNVVKNKKTKTKFLSNILDGKGADAKSIASSSMIDDNDDDEKQDYYFSD